MPAAVIITGLLRDRLDLYRTLDAALCLRDEGRAAEIWLSTWFGELDRHDGLARKLARTGIEVLESAPPPRPPAIAPQPMWNTWVQATALRRALQQVPRDRPVLKLRTDKAASITSLFAPCLDERPAPAAPLPWAPRVLEAKVAVRLVRAAVPLHVSDFVFYGTQTDLLALSERDGAMTADGVPGSVGVENRWLAAPFVRAVPRLASYYACAHAFDLMACLSRWADGAEGAPPPALWDVLAANFALLDAYTTLVDDEPAPDRFTIEAVFASDDAGPARSVRSGRGLLRNIAGPGVLRALARGKVADSPAADAYRAAVARLAGTAEQPLDPDEVEALRAFAVRHGAAPRAVRALMAARPASRSPVREAFAAADALAPLLDADGAGAEERAVAARVLDADPDATSAVAYRRIAEALASGAKTLPTNALVWFERAARLRDPAAQTAYAREVLTRGAPGDAARVDARALLEDAARRHPPAAELLRSLGG